MAFTVLFIGDSFSCQGGHSLTVYTSAPSWLTQTLSPVLNNDSLGLVTGNGFQAFSEAAYDNESFGWSSTGETGLVPTMLAAVDSLASTGPNYNYANSGSGWGPSSNPESGISRLANAVSAGIQPDAIIIGMGTNPNIGKRSTTLRDAEVVELWDDALALNPKFIIQWLSPSLNADPTYDPALNGADTSWEDYCDAQRQYITDLKANSYPNDPIYLYDAFTDLGGHNVDLADFKTNNIHPSAQGSEKLGNGLAEVFTNAYSREVLNVAYIGLDPLDFNTGVAQNMSSVRVRGMEITRAYQAAGNETVINLGGVGVSGAGADSLHIGLYEGSTDNYVTEDYVLVAQAEVAYLASGNPLADSKEPASYNLVAGKYYIVAGISNNLTITIGNQFANSGIGSAGQSLVGATATLVSPLEADAWAGFDLALYAEYTVAGGGSPTLTTPYSDINATKGDSYGPVDFTSNWSGADSYKASVFPQGIDASDLTQVQGTFTGFGTTQAAVNATNEAGTTEGNQFNWNISNVEVLVAETGIQQVANGSPFDLRSPDNHGILSSGFAHNFVGVRFYSDAAGTTEVPITGTADVMVETVEAPADSIAAEGTTGQRWSFAGNAKSATIEFTGGNTAHYFKVFARQNKT